MKLSTLTSETAPFTDTNPTLYQSMVEELLTIDDYTESVIALGTDIPLNAIKNIHQGILRNPNDVTLGKLLRFYYQMTH